MFREAGMRTVTIAAALTVFAAAAGAQEAVRLDLLRAVRAAEQAAPGKAAGTDGSSLEYASPTGFRLGLNGLLGGRDAWAEQRKALWDAPTGRLEYVMRLELERALDPNLDMPPNRLRLGYTFGSGPMLVADGPLGQQFYWGGDRGASPLAVSLKQAATLFVIEQLVSWIR